jgi:putative ABC transport system ATP-binding protein
VVFQFFQLLPTLTGLENVMCRWTSAAETSGGAPERALSLLELVGVADQAD